MKKKRYTRIERLLTLQENIGYNILTVKLSSITLNR
ncbi:MAG: hypothetical protein ACJAYF_000280 [Arenicella sp.]|jgi:hypothetical protein